MMIKKQHGNAVLPCVLYKKILKALHKNMRGFFYVCKIIATFACVYE